MKIEELIEEMQKVKAKHPALEIQEIIGMFNIIALKDLTNSLILMRSK